MYHELFKGGLEGEGVECVEGREIWILGERELEYLKLNILSDSCSAEYNEIDV